VGLERRGAARRHCAALAALFPPRRLRYCLARIACAGETVVVWDAATGAPLHRALVWQDQRGAALCASLSAAHALGADRLRAQTGLPLVPYFTASKLAWLLEHVPGLRAAAESGAALAGTVDAWLVWKLTAGAVHATDVTNASRTLLADIHARPLAAWDAGLCALFGVPPRMLPAIRASAGGFGVCAPGSPLPGVRIGGVLGDQQAALFGQACFAPGEAKNTYGSGCLLLMNTGATAVASAHGLLTTIAYQLTADAPPVYALEGSVAIAGAVVTWLRDNLKLVPGAAAVEALARSDGDCSGGVVFVPAFNGLFAPYWRADARGVLVGLSAVTRPAHIARAALEAVALQAKDLLDAMGREALGRGLLSPAQWRAAELRVDGGMTANGLLMQAQADFCRKTVVRPVVAETTALGAAYAAGLAAGVWASLDELRAHWRASQRWAPAMPARQALAHIRRWHAAVAKAVNWADGADNAFDAAPPAAPPTPEEVAADEAASLASSALLPPRSDERGAAAAAAAPWWRQAAAAAAAATPIQLAIAASAAAIAALCLRDVARGARA
jgi:glycerol kinase